MHQCILNLLLCGVSTALDQTKLPTGNLLDVVQCHSAKIAAIRVRRPLTLFSKTSELDRNMNGRHLELK